MWKPIRILLLLTLTIMSLSASAKDYASSQSQWKKSVNCNYPRPEWIFCEDFQAGNVNTWDQSPLPKKENLTVVKAIDVSPEIDNLALQIRVNPGRGGAGLNKTFTPAGYNRLYARWYQKYESGFDFSAKNHGHGFHAGDRWKKGVAGKRPMGDDYFTVQIEYEPATYNRLPRPYIYAYYRGMNMDCSDPDGKCWGDHFPCMIAARYCKNDRHRPTLMPPALKDNRWYCVELMVDAGDAVASRELASGEINFWIDGQAYGPWKNLWLRTDENIRVNHFWLGLFHHGQHSEQGILYDNIVVSTSRIGCLSTVNSP